MKYKGEIILAVLFLYVIALGVVTYDTVFNEPPHWFPPKLEKQAIKALEKFRSTSAEEQRKGQEELLNIEDFVTVPLLVHYLRDDNPQVRKLVFNSLDKIAARLQRGTPPPEVLFREDSTVAQRRANHQAWKSWMKQNEERL